MSAIKNWLELAGIFLRLGATAFGGPAAHIAMMNDEFVTRRKWMKSEEFLDLISATNLVPGPNSTEMAIHIGYQRAGWPGLLIAGSAFITPAFLIVWLLAWLYKHYGQLPTASHLFWGIKPIILAVIFTALIKFAQTSFKGSYTVVIAIASLLAMLLGAPELAILATAIVIGLIKTGYLRRSQTSVNLITPLSILPTVIIFNHRLMELSWVFLKIGATIFGSGYVLISYLRQSLVIERGWLTDGQLLDAIAIGQFTPGPVLTTATFIGYLIADNTGALLATIAIFLPSFIIVALLNPIVHKLRQWPATRTVFDTLNAAIVGLIAAVLWQLSALTLISISSLIIAIVATVLLLKWQINSTWLIIAGAVLGFVHQWL